MTTIRRRYLGFAGVGALAIAASGMSAVAPAQQRIIEITPPPPGWTPAAGEETLKVITAAEAFREAMLKADKAAFEKLCAEELSYGHSSGRIETKAQFIAASTSGKTVWKSITYSEGTVKVAGGTAIIRHKLTGETSSEGKTNAINIGVLEVWAKRGADWKLLARQAYRL